MFEYDIESSAVNAVLYRCCTMTHTEMTMSPTTIDSFTLLDLSPHSSFSSPSPSPPVTPPRQEKSCEEDSDTDFKTSHTGSQNAGSYATATGAGEGGGWNRREGGSDSGGENSPGTLVDSHCGAEMSFTDSGCGSSYVSLPGFQVDCGL
jgi:hypothetical protein